MSRPFRILLPGLFVIAALTFSSCVGTIYDRTYAYHKTYFKPQKDKKEVSAETILGALDKKPDANALLDSNAAPGGLPPADNGVPGLPPPGGVPDPNAPPAAPGAPAVPGLPPAPGAPPAPGTPPPPPPN